MNKLLSKILDNARQMPDHVIIIDKTAESSYTFRKLFDTAGKIAAKLIRSGVRPHSFVTIELPRIKEYIAAMLGTWMAGAAFVSLSSSYPGERIRYIQQDCHAAGVIDEKFLRDLDRETPLTEPIPAEGDDPAIVIYTSGSTGKPKGVLHSHRSINDSVIRYAEFSNSPKDFHVALGAPFTFIASVQAVLEPLYSGLTIFLMPYQTMRDPVLLSEFIDDNQINRIFVIPKILKELHPKGDSLKVVATGGERVSGIYSDRYRIFVAYGQTESAGLAMAYEIRKKWDNTPIGKPIGQSKAYVLDENGQPAREGELCLAGHFATGYLNMPEETAKTFTDNPFAQQDGFPKLLHTGDIVRFGEEDNIIFVNRKDWMVKINGQRVEPGEIESIIKQIDGIYDAALKDFKNQYGQVYLVAYYVEKEPIPVEEIRKAIADKLPSYMIPAFFVRLDKLPVNANGKLDRSQLNAPEAGNYKTEYAAPETDIQRQLCKAYEEVLGVEHIGIDDDFFALGGDSIKSAMIAAKCRIYHITTAAIIQGKTPRLIEGMMIRQSRQKKTTSAKSKPLSYPLTSFERGMYIEQKMDPDSTVYNLNIGVLIKGSHRETVIRSLKAVFAAHEAFHSYYGEKNGMPVRILIDKLPDIQCLTAENTDQIKQAIDQYHTPFDLNAGIPAKAFVYTTPEGIIGVHLAVHHIAFDGGSAKTFVQQLIAGLKEKEVTAAEIDLSDLYDRDTREQYKNGMAFYRELFKDGVPVNEMPIKGKRPKKHPLSDKEISFSYTSEQLSKLDNTARRYGATEFELIFSAISMVLGKYTASEDVVLGIPTNMRSGDADEVIGMFVNTAPVRVKPVRTMELENYISSVSQAVRHATYGAALPFEDIAAEFVKQRDESRNPIFDVSVNYLWTPPAYQDDRLTIEMYSPLQKMSRDIGIVMRKDENELRFVIQYSSELFSEDVIRGFIQQIRYTLSRLSENIQTVREALALPNEQMDRLMGFSQSEAAPQEEVLLHRLFEKAAAKAPDKTALIAVDRSLTFRELNEQANIAANYLIAAGIRPGDSVALLLPRTSAFFACLFGVSKAGAAFIPCDPQYPADRINYIIQDSGASFIITTKEKAGDYPAEKVIDVTQLSEGISSPPPEVPVTGEDLAYMIYTSGSTGKPKGVMLKHKGICNYLTPHKANSHIHAVYEKVERYLSITTVSFDMSFKEHTTALCNGKTLIFAGDEEMNDPRALTRLINEYHADCINATPSRLLQYLEYEPFAQALKNCRVIMSGGEAYSSSLLSQLRQTAPEAEIYNTYGPTEITVSCNAAKLNDSHTITVGPPLLNYKEYIVDKFGDIAPFGVVGELYIGGIGVAAGYKNLPEKTKAAFIQYHGERMYRSGDYAKWDAQGNVQILGRADHQIKLRGLRIEPGEIEGLIEAQPGIKKAAVLVRKLNGQDHLCAYFTAENAIDTAALRQELKKHLTHYMVPTAYLQLHQLPQTANGKTDIKALPEPVPVTLGEYAAPANDTEAFFCHVFEKVLKLDKVGATDNFFEIGGTSLIVTSVVVAAAEKGFEISYGDVFRSTTPRDLAAIFNKGSEQNTDAVFDFQAYDYTAINQLLKQNTIDSFIKGEQRQLGNVLITGATGYMGAHLLAQFLEQEKGTAYCLVRKGKHKAAIDRLRNIMFYYFDDRYEQDMNTRVIALDGDVTHYESFIPLEEYSIQTVFNCAANVKHFSSGTDIEDINVGGAVNCIRLCQKLGARLIHFSTVSVSGTAASEERLANACLDEQSFYFGQHLNNKYISSKLMSERMVLEQVAKGTLDGKIIRVGTLAARESDGEFQINFLTNNFMGRLRSYAILGCFPYQMIENQVCMGPIDTSCDAFLRLARTPAACCLFNAVNNHTLPLGDIIRQMNRAGMMIRFVDASEFFQTLKQAQQDPKKAAILSSMTAYMGTEHGEKVRVIPFAAHYTTQVLARLGFFWNASNEKYVNDFINVLEGFGFFDKQNLNR